MEQPLEPDEADKGSRAAVRTRLWMRKSDHRCGSMSVTCKQQRGGDFNLPQSPPELKKSSRAERGRDPRCWLLGFLAVTPPISSALTSIFWPRGWRRWRDSFSSKVWKRSAEEERNHPHQRCLNLSIPWIHNRFWGCCVFRKSTPTSVSDGRVNQRRQTKAAVNTGNSAQLGPLCQISWWLILETLNKYCCVQRANVRAVKITNYI